MLSDVWAVCCLARCLSKQLYCKQMRALVWTVLYCTIKQQLLSFPFLHCMDVRYGSRGKPSKFIISCSRLISLVIYIYLICFSNVCMYKTSLSASPLLLKQLISASGVLFMFWRHCGIILILLAMQDYHHLTKLNIKLANRLFTHPGDMEQHQHSLKCF